MAAMQETPQKPQTPCETVQYQPEPEVEKPEIPLETLNTLLEDIEDDRIKRVEQCYLYGESKQRFRINVWQQWRIEGSICPRNRIGYSFFVEYDPETGMLDNQTKVRKAEDDVVNFFAR